MALILNVQAAARKFEDMAKTAVFKAILGYRQKFTSRGS